MARFDPDAEDGERTQPGHRRAAASTESTDDYVSPEEKAEALAYFVARRGGKAPPVLLNREAMATLRARHLRLVSTPTSVSEEAELPPEGPFLPPHFWWYAAGAVAVGAVVGYQWRKHRRHRAAVAPVASSPSEKPAELVGLDVLCCLGAA